jgi:uncharacterized protein (TIGR02996 family)
MSNGEALRAAIRANPTDATVRLVFADWLDENDQPGGDLVRLLINSPYFWEVVPQVVEWFHRHYGWPLPERLNTGEWVREILVAERWPDSDRLRECVVTIAKRMLPVARRFLPAEHYRLLGVLNSYAQLSEVEGGLLECGHITWAAATVAAVCLSGPGDASNLEYCKQVHVVAWAWLGLPPLRKAPELSDTIPEPPPAPAPEPQRPWWRRLFGG